MAAQTAPIQFRDKLLEVEIETRTPYDGSSPSLIARRDLERYYRLLRRSLRTFSEPEAKLIVRACVGWHPDADSVHFLWAQVDEAIRSQHLDEEYGVDGATLVERLRGLTPFEAMAVADAAEIVWYAAKPKGEDEQGFIYVTEDEHTVGLVDEPGWRREYGEPTSLTTTESKLRLEHMPVHRRARRETKQQEAKQP